MEAPSDSSSHRVFFKRAMDLVGAVAGLLILAPVFLAIVIAIRLESTGPSFFRQSRVGTGGRIFRVFKFRTMVDGAEEQKAALTGKNESDGCLFKIRDDPRLTRVGRLLRRSSLDELPQLLNILRGEMSLVGPRPLPVDDYDFEVPGMQLRLVVRPGLTGLWQVSGRSELGTAELIELDSYYVGSWSPLLDLRIIAQTVPAVLSGRGAH